MCGNKKIIRGFYQISVKFSIHVCLLFAVNFLIISVNAQNNDKKWQLNGYVKDMQTAWIGSGGTVLTDNLIHNRINFKWFPNNHWKFTLEARNRLLWGEIVKNVTNYNKELDKDYGIVDLSFVPASNNSFILNSFIDRANINYSLGKFNIVLGRQRINWGMNLVWNPNDIFNTFSYFDFDYEERPGSDAVRLQYYQGAASSTELVVKPGRTSEQAAFAWLYKFNKWNYDIQFLAGKVGKDFAAGAGWSGNIKGAGFRGEATYFFPYNKIEGSSGVISASLSGDYTFAHSIFANIGILYNSSGKTGLAGGMDLLSKTQLTAKKISNARYSAFGQISMPATPLLSLSFSGIINPADKSSFLGPSMVYSIARDFEMMLSGQVFIGKDGSEFGDIGQLYFLRFRYSF